MRLAIHQPNLMPYLGFWAKAAVVDVVDLALCFQFTSGGADSWTHRCRLGSDSKFEFLTMPIVKVSGFQECGQVSLKQELVMERFALLKKVHGSSPHWSEFGPAVMAKAAESVGRGQSLAELNVALVQHVASVLQMKTVFSMSDERPVGDTPTLRLQNICDRYGADEYVAGGGGRGYMTRSEFKSNLIFCDPVLPDGFKTVSVVSAILERGVEWTKQVIGVGAKLSEE